MKYFKNLKLTAKITIFTLIFLAVFSILYGITGRVFLNILLQQETADDVGELELNFLSNQRAETQVLSAVSNTINMDPEVVQLFLKKDREGLYKHLLPTFENLKSEFSISILDFYTSDRTNILRMQNKDVYGDKDAHDPFFNQVDKTQKEAVGLGFEHRDIAVREVKPFLSGDKPVGYIEIGESMTHLIAELQKRTQDEFAVFADIEAIPEDELVAVKNDPALKDLIKTSKHIELMFTSKNELFKECFKDNISDLVQNSGNFLINPQLRDNGNRYTCSALNMQGINGEHLGSILVLSDISSYLDTVDRNGYIIIGLLILFSAAIFLFSNYFVRRLITNPLLKLNDVAGEISQGDLDKRIDVNSTDEIGQLSTAFNNMVDKLKESYKNLENKIHERTADLATKTEQLEKKNEEADEREQAILNIMEDLDTEKKDLEKTNAKDEAFLKSIGEGLIVTDSEGRVILANKTALELTNLSFDQLLNKVWAKDFPLIEDEEGNPVPYEKTPVYGALHNKGTLTTKFFYKIAEGKRFPALVTAAPVIIDGQNQGSVVVFRDITKEEEIDKAKSEFISLASHQLRTPLSGIKWFLELLKDTKDLTPEQTDFVSNISKSTERMIELVNALLNISRIESGRITINPQPTDLTMILQDVVRSLQHIIDEKNLQVKFDIEENLPQISVDQKMIKVVYENLLSNAVKYTPAGKQIIVTIKKQGDEIVSEVIDEGLGIPEKDHKRVFEKFYRGDNVTKVVPDGTGLGLYLTKSIIDSSKGKIGYESKENQGSKFWFSLPLEGMPAKQGEVGLS